MTCDVFIRTSYLPPHGSSDPIRTGMRALTWLYWSQQGIAFNVLRPTEDLPAFGMRSKKSAETLANTPIYLISDEDCLPLGDRFIERGLEIMERHPLYGILTATSVCDGHYPAGVALPAEEVVPLHAVGGVAFVRKGILTEFNPCRPDQVDDTICQEFTRKGYKTGVIPSLKFNHCGLGYSIPITR